MSAKPTAHLFDSNNPEPEAARRVALEWLRFNPEAEQLPAATALARKIHEGADFGRDTNASA